MGIAGCKVLVSSATSTRIQEERGWSTAIQARTAAFITLKRRYAAPFIPCFELLFPIRFLNQDFSPSPPGNRGCIHLCEDRFIIEGRGRDVEEKWFFLFSLSLSFFFRTREMRIIRVLEFFHLRRFYCPRATIVRNFYSWQYILYAKFVFI